MPKLILSLDGGGIRGAATAQFLTLLEDKLTAEHGKSIRDCVDFYAGTSTGSIIALALATTKLTMAQINALYNVHNAQIIFTENKGLLQFDGINAPKYEATDKTKFLKQKLGNAKVGDIAANKHLLAVAYAVEKRQPIVIKSTKNAHLDLFSYRVADASSAAPTYFPTTSLVIPPQANEHWLIDGGVIANNPTMCAIAEAKKVWQGESISDLRVLSIGTGYTTRKINGPASTKWGALQWMTQGHILDILSDERVVAYQAGTIMDSGSYIRVNAELRRQIGLPEAPDDAMDDVSAGNIRCLKKLGELWFEKYGQASMELLLNTYQGPSLDCLDVQSGKPKIVNNG